jgi:hypothetical protein
VWEICDAVFLDTITVYQKYSAYDVYGKTPCLTVIVAYQYKTVTRFLVLDIVPVLCE